MGKTSSKIFWLYLLAVAAWIFLTLLVNNKADWDLWGVMSFGALLDQNPGWFPYHDPFSYTALGQRWIYHEWGSGVVFYQVFKHGGSAALFWLKLALVLAIVLAACHHKVWRMPEPPAEGGWRGLLFNFTLLACVYLLLPICSTTIRCHLFSFLGYAVFLALLLRYQRGQWTQAIWALPVLTLVWANLHGGFITGLVAIGAFWLRAVFDQNTVRAKQLGLVLLASLLAVLVNPYGFDFVRTMISAWSLPRDTISEWGNVMTLEVAGYGALYSGLLVFWLLAALWHWSKSPRVFPHIGLLLVLTGINGWLHYKLTPLFLITILAVGFDLLKTVELPKIKSRLLQNHPALGLAGDLAVAAFPLVLAALAILPAHVYLNAQKNPLMVRVQGVETVQKDKKLTRFAYPIGLVSFIKQEKIQGNLWVPFAWGEFLYWALYPDCRISMDGRYETIYSPAVYNDYYAFYNKPYRLEGALKYPTTHVLVPSDDETLLKRVRQNPTWHPVYQDDLVVLFGKTPRLGGPVSHLAKSVYMDAYPGWPDRFRQPEQ